MRLIHFTDQAATPTYILIIPINIVYQKFYLLKGRILTGSSKMQVVRGEPLAEMLHTWNILWQEGNNSGHATLSPGSLPSKIAIKLSIARNPIASLVSSVALPI